MQLKKANRGKPIGRRTILQIQILGILYSNLPYPVDHTNNFTVTTCTKGTTEHTGCKSLLQQYVSALSDRKQRWQDLELPRCTSIREKF